jgi:hypothetical protein
MEKICRNELTISGSNRPLQGLYDKINGQDRAILKIVPNFKISSAFSERCRITYLKSPDLINKNIEITFTSEDIPPLKSILKLSSQYPTLNFHVVYPGEEGSPREIAFQDGVCSWVTSAQLN